MTYEVKRKVGNNWYLYRQTSYRQGGKVKTHYEYVGPVDPKRRKGPLGQVLSEIGEALHDKIRTRKIWEDGGETEEELQARVAREREEYRERDRINGILSGPTITMAQFAEVVAHQDAPETDRTDGAPEPDDPPEPQEPAEPQSQSSDPSTYLIFEVTYPDGISADPALQEPSVSDTPPSEPAQPSEQSDGAAQE